MLTLEAQKVRRELIREHGDTAEVRRLAEVAAGLWQRAAEAGALVEQHGLTVTTARGSMALNPAAVIEKNARLAFLTAIRALRQRPKREKLGRPTRPEALARQAAPISAIGRKYFADR